MKKTWVENWLSEYGHGPYFWYYIPSTVAPFLALALLKRGWCRGVPLGWVSRLYFKPLLRHDKVGEDYTTHFCNKVDKDGEASENPDDWGECHSDCPMRAYRDNQVWINNNKKRPPSFWDPLGLCNISFLGDQELVADMKSLAKEKPSLAKTYIIGNSVLGQPLQVVLKKFGQ